MLELREQRDSDFMAECRRQIRSFSQTGRQIEMRAVVESALSVGAPAYYVNHEYARRVVSSLLREGADREARMSGRADRKAMMMEIAVKCREVMERRGVKLSEALTEVLVSGRASGWFMSAEYARKLYYAIRKGSHRRRGLRRRKLF